MAAWAAVQRPAVPVSVAFTDIFVLLILMNYPKIKLSKQGFTLIELLVVIAIIGILSAVVLASLDSARSKATVASIKGNLRNMIPQAALSYDTTNNYSGACASITNMLNAISAQGATVSCFSYNNSGLSDIYLRWGVTAIIYNATPPITAWSSSNREVVTWDAKGVNSSGVSVGTDVTMTWDQANTACATAGGRLPTMEELHTLSNATYTASGNTTYTPPGFVANNYWSGTTVPSDSINSAYYVAMYNSGISNVSKTNNYYVRCVR